MRLEEGERKAVLARVPRKMILIGVPLGLFNEIC
jgi:hypothetical protein